MKNIFFSALLLATLSGTSQVTYAQKGITSVLGNLSQDQIGKGLKEALDKGVQDQVSSLSKKDGFYKNKLTKILMPQELERVDKALRSVGMGGLMDEGILLLNRAAENAVGEAAPIMVSAIASLSFNDAANILLGGDSAATNYLKTKTSKQLDAKFTPIIEKSLSQVGADKVWETIFTNYNSLPLVKKVNPNLTSYVTEKTMDGMFTMIAVEENEIRDNIPGSRSTNLLKDVFSKQDNKNTPATATKGVLNSIKKK